MLLLKLVERWFERTDRISADARRWDGETVEIAFREGAFNDAKTGWMLRLAWWLVFQAKKEMAKTNVY